MLIRVRERGPGIKDLQAILDGRYDSPTGLGLGILGAKRLMDQFEIESSEGGATVTMVKGLPKRTAPFDPAAIWRGSRPSWRKHAPQGLLEELQVQNQELLRTLQELRDRQAEIAELHTRELEETNRGVVALYSELDENAKELQRISELKSRFLSNMSHEFRSPLNTILSMSGFLLERQQRRADPRTGEAGQRSSARPPRASRPWSTTCWTWPRSRRARPSSGPKSFEVAELFEVLRGTTEAPARAGVGGPDRRGAGRDSDAPYRRRQARRRS